MELYSMRSFVTDFFHNIMFSRDIYVIARISALFIFMAE